MEYLYHYTSIETLALILSKRTFRFNSLDRVDDLQEKETADIKNIGQFCYISSWTDDPLESIPMWKMYSSLESGVRIKMRKYPFLEKENTAQMIQEALHQSVVDKSGGDYPKTMIPFTESFKKGFIAFPNLQKDMLFQVEYTSDIDKLVPRLVSYDSNSTNIAINMLGKYKNIHWKFQKEWRYIFTAFPYDLQKLDSNGHYVIKQNQDLLAGRLRRPFDFYDMPLSEEAFFDMEIMMGPRISKGNKIIVECLVKEYNSAAILRESTLIGKI